MSLLNTLKLTHSYRQKTKVDEAISKVEKELDEVISFSKKILSSGLKLSSEAEAELNRKFELEIENKNNEISKLRENVLSSRLLISREQCLYPYYTTEEKHDVVDSRSLVGMCPRVKVEELKSVASKIGFCIFNEDVFNEENESENKESAESMARLLRDNGYKIYYLSPLSGFDYQTFIQGKKNIYDNVSYWGQHLSTYNSLALSINVFRDIYAEIEVLRSENEAVRNAIDLDRSAMRNLHNQFKSYVDHVYENMQLLEAPLRGFITKENDKLQKSFEKARAKALENNERYKDNPYETVEYYRMFDRKTGEYEGTTSYVDMFSDSDTRYVKASYRVNRLLPVPEKAFQYKHFYAKHFHVKDLNQPQEIKRFKKNYTLANVKKLIKCELSNNYLMLAIKGDVMNPEQEDAIVLSSWGEGLSDETMVATGVKQ